MKYLASAILLLSPIAAWAVTTPGPAPLPEPSTLALFGAAAAGLVFVARRNKNK